MTKAVERGPVAKNVGRQRQDFSHPVPSFLGVHEYVNRLQTVPFPEINYKRVRG